MGWVLDLDGVVWLAHEPIPGAAEAVARLRRAGEQVLFVTNNAEHRVDDVARRLVEIGVPAARQDVLTSAVAAATLVSTGERVLAFAGPGVVEALEARGAVVVPVTGRGAVPAVDTVVVGRHADLAFSSLTAAVRAVAGGARLIATNTDPVYPSPQGPEPGAGALLAAVTTAAGRPADVVAGKPHAAMADLVQRRLGSTGWVVGDSPATDGGLARRLGYRFALVLSGVTAGDDPLVTPSPEVVDLDLGAVVDRVLGDGVASTS